MKLFKYSVVSSSMYLGFPVVLAFFLLIPSLFQTPHGVSDIISSFTPNGPFPQTLATKDILDVTFHQISSGTIEHATFTATGRQLLIVSGTNVGQGFTYTLRSVPSGVTKRTSDITATLDTGDYHAFWFGSKTGWATSANTYHLIPSSLTGTLRALVLTIP